MRFALLLLTLVFSISIISAQKKVTDVSSPDKDLKATIWLDDSGKPTYTIDYMGKTVMLPSKLGVILDNGNLAEGLTVVSVAPVVKITDNYKMIYGKKENCTYNGNNRRIQFKNKSNQLIDIIFQVSKDGVAFRYYFPGAGAKIVKEELSSWHFPADAKAWLQPMQVSKSGWEQTNPAYEEHYQKDIAVGTKSPTAAGWVYPALFQSGDATILLTEASLDSNYCATRLKSESPDGEYSIGFPDAREIYTGGGILPRSNKPFFSPWRVIFVGNPYTLLRSTLGTDLAKPAIKMDKSFIKPGKSSWSWIMSKDDSIVYSEQVRYVDFAADMNWQYCLVDADWDRKIGYDKIGELVKYAAAKNVGILCWYNSAGDWNTVKYTPKGKLLTHADRVKEFGRLKQLGVKGVKIDFFGGDGQSVIKYYMEILQDAADAGLMVNFHGATLPRGWARTYPNLMTTEAVRGFEMITFNQSDANEEAAHCAMLPFTRNAFDPMDFTPMNLYKIPTRVKRKTSSAFELALSVLFLSGIQHFAESPDGMTHVPDYVKQFLRDLPTRWDDVHFVGANPGLNVAIARKSGNKWYIGGINGMNTPMKITTDYSFFKKQKATIIRDGGDNLSFTTESWTLDGKTFKEFVIPPSGGYVVILE